MSTQKEKSGTALAFRFFDGSLTYAQYRACRTGRWATGTFIKDRSGVSRAK